MTTRKISRDHGFTDVHRGDVAVESMGVLPVSINSPTPNRFIVTHRIATNDRVVKSEMELTREQVAWLYDRFADILNSDSAYEAWLASRQEPASTMEGDGRFAAHGPEPLPATDDEWRDRLLDGGAP